MPNIFLSYAEPDSPLVTRVYADLRRAKAGDVWCYEITSEYGVDFREEYRRYVGAAHVFTLFDSRHARGSGYVAEEVALCRELGAARLLVCLAEPHGSWRKAEFFPGHNNLVYIDFTDYETGIQELCGCLGASYVPLFELPRDQEFVRELTEAGRNFAVEQRQQLLRKYHFFRSVHAHDPELAEAQLLVLIREHLHDNEVSITAPLLALGALRNQRGRYAAAADAFEEATKRAPRDPRGWSGHGVALFRLHRYREAAATFDTSLRCIDEAKDPAHRMFLAEVRHNAASAFLAAGEAAAAWDRIAEAAIRPDAAIEDLILGGKILLACKDATSRRLIGLAARRAAANERIEPDLVIDLVEGLRQFELFALAGDVLACAVARFPEHPAILRQWAVHQAENGDHCAATAQYRHAVRRNPNDMRLLSELAMLLKGTGDPEGFRQLVRRCFDLVPNDPTEEYFLGLAHFLEGREETAHFYHMRSRRSAICREWPYYRELTG